MYLPENDAQMYDILVDLRTYAEANALHRLAEEIDDALVLLAAEGRPGRPQARLRAVARAEDR
jgi:hypothetical protein